MAPLPKIADRRIEKFQREPAVEAFDCGVAEPNSFLQRFALINQQNGPSQTYIGLVDRTVAGYHSLAFGQVTHAHTPERVTKGLSHHPIPIMLLARLAVDRAWQGQGIGSGLLKDAMLQTLNAADIAGIRALTVHAKDEKARAFYEHFDFIHSPSDPFHLFILLKDVRRIMA